MAIHIELPFACCENCPELDATTVRDALFANDGELIESTTTIKCANEHRCRMIARHMKESKAHDQD